MERTVISRDEAEAIARARAAAQGWALTEPIAIEEIRQGWSRTLRQYRISSNPRLRGTRTHFTIDAETGAIVAEGHVRR